MSDSKNKVDKNFAGDGEKARIWFEKNWKKLFLAIAVVIIAVMSVLTFIYLKDRKEAEASKDLANAKVSELPGLLEKTPDASGAAAARIRLAEDLLAKKEYAAAKVQFSAVANDASATAELRSRAKLSAASCDELSGNAKAAAEAFAVLMNDTTVPQRVRDEAGFQAGRIFLALNDARGKEILKKLASAPVAEKMTQTDMANPWKKNAKALLNQAK